MTDAYNMARYFLDHNIEAGRGEKVALRWAGGQWTYRDIVRESNKLGNVLRDLGVEMEDRVYIVLPDVPEFAPAFFATLRVGAVVTMGNPLLPPDDLVYYCNYTRAKVVITNAEVADRLPRAECRHLKHVLVVGRDYEARMAKAPAELAWAETTKDDVACWLFSGGTTGRSKGVVHRHQDFPFNTDHYAKQVLRMRESDVTLSVPKLFFGYATGTNLMFPFAVGATACVFSERSTADAMFENLRRFRPTVLTNVPTMINAMVQHPEAGRQDLSCLRLAITAGEALPPELYSRWREMFRVELLDGIGSAEMFHIYISQREGEVRPGSLGRLVPGYHAEVRDESNAVLKAGEVGRLWVRGESAGLGYFNEHDKSVDTFHADWVKSGDLFRVDEEGYFWYSGRADDLLKVGGVFVAPIEVENCLLKHPAVAEVAVLGYSDDAGLVKVGALVVKKSEVSEGELQDFVKKTIAPYKYPRRVKFVPALPKTDRGKIDRKNLPELLK